MNKLNQHLNDSLSELELSPSMEAEILMNAEKPARKVRFRSRAVVTALLVVCLLSVTAVAAVISTGWDWSLWNDLTVIPEQPTHAPLAETSQAYLADVIDNHQERGSFVYQDSFAEFEETVGISLLRTDDMRLYVDDSTGKKIDVFVGGPDSANAQINALYGGDIHGEDGCRIGLMYFDMLVDFRENPTQVTHSFSEKMMVGALRTQYEIQSLGVVADLIYWPNKPTVYAFFQYDDASYTIKGCSVEAFDDHSVALESFCSLLELLHE